MRYFLIMCFVALPSVSTAIFSAFACDDQFGDSGEHSFLVADYRVSCSSYFYRRGIVPYAIICVVAYPVGVHVLYCVILWRHRDAIRHNKGIGAEHISFLYSAYSPTAWFWEPVDSLRRLSCTGFLVFFNGNLRLLMAFLVAYFHQALYMARSPYADTENNRLASTANVVLVFVLLVVNFRAVLSSSVITVTCTVMPLLMFLVVLGHQLWSLWQRRSMVVTLDELGATRTVDDETGSSGIRPKLRRGSGSLKLSQTFEHSDQINHETVLNMLASGDASRQRMIHLIFSSLERLLEPPISSDDWRKSIALLENLPMDDHGDVTLGLSYFIGDAEHFATLDEEMDGGRSRVLTHVSEQDLPATPVTLNESEITFLEGSDNSAGLTVRYEVEPCRPVMHYTHASLDERSFVFSTGNPIHRSQDVGLEKRPCFNPSDAPDTRWHKSGVAWRTPHMRA